MRILYFISAILFITITTTSCKTAYQSGQTPDDLYLASERPQDISVNKQDQQEDETYYRMRCRNRRWRDLDDNYGYNQQYSPYYYGYQSAYYYNPYYCGYPVFYYDIKNHTPRTTNLNSYQTSHYQTITNIKTGQVRQLTGTDKYNNSNQSSNSIRSVFDGKSSSSGDHRTYSPSSGNGSSNGGSIISRPARQ